MAALTMPEKLARLEAKESTFSRPRTFPLSIASLLAREGTMISWADLTFNPWIGCTKMGPACDGCYAEARDRRFAGGAHWGPGAPRARTTESNWAKPARWNRIAFIEKMRLRVFCASLADWADAEVDAAWRADLARVILETPWLDWMLLSKRFTRIEMELGRMFGREVPPNVVIGATMVTQREVDLMLPYVETAKRNMGVPRLFLSMEPLLERVVLPPSARGIVNEIMVGGESGPTKRHMDTDWAALLRGQANHYGIAFHMKQLSEFDHPRTFEQFDTFPAEIRVRERGW